MICATIAWLISSESSHGRFPLRVECSDLFIDLASHRVQVLPFDLRDEAREFTLFFMGVHLSGRVEMLLVLLRLLL